MPLGLQNKSRSQLRLLNRGVYAIGAISGIVLIIYFTTFFNINSPQETQASNSNQALKIDGIEIENIISYYNFNKYPILKSTKGLSASSISDYANIKPGGIENSSGLSAGNQSENIKMVYDIHPKFNSAGIQVQFYFKQLENSGVLYKRGKTFELSFHGNDLRVKYALYKDKNEIIKINSKIPNVLDQNEEFVHLKFLYEPTLGLAVVQKNHKNVWKNRTEPDLPLNWESTKPFEFAKKLNGAGSSETLIDELIIATTTPPIQMPFELLSFHTEKQNESIVIDWHTYKEVGTQYFIVEKSIDGKKFEEIGRTKAAGNSEELVNYSLVDPFPTEGISFYRLIPSGMNIPTTLLPVTAIDYQIDITEAKR